MESSNIEIVKETYNEIAHHFSAILNENNSSEEEINAVEEFLGLLPDKEECRIADLGCGVGKHGRYCANRGYRVTGIDISNNMIDLANRYNNDEKYAKIEKFKVVDICDFQTEERYDGVISFYAFIHLTYEQAKKTLVNLKRHLKKGAVVAISVYKGNREGFYQELLKGRNNKDLCLYFKDYQLAEFKKLFDETGYILMNMYEWIDIDPIATTDIMWNSGVLYAIARFDE